MWDCRIVEAHPSPLWMPFLRRIWSPSLAAATAACSDRKLKPFLPVLAHINTGIAPKLIYICWEVSELCFARSSLLLCLNEWACKYSK